MSSPDTETVTVKLSSAYRFADLDRLILTLEPFLTLTERRRILLDLSGLVYLCPTAVALVTAALMRLVTKGYTAEGSFIEYPSSALVRNYLMRMDFFAMLAAEVDEEPFERHEAVGFRPCQEFRTIEELRPVTLDLAGALGEACQTDTAARGAIKVCLDELAENVIHHADTGLGGFAAAQASSKKHMFEIGMIDLGVGIRASLTKNPDYADITDDVDAIQTALRPRVTSTPERNSGIGLSVTRLLLRENGGMLLVRSGEAAVYSGVREHAQTTPVGFSGTLVALRARTDRPLDLGEVYRKLDDDNSNAGNDDD